MKILFGILIGIILTYMGLRIFITFYIKRHLGIEESYLCDLIITQEYEKDFNGLVYDFSKYQDYNIICLTTYTTASDTHHGELEPPIILVKDTVVNLLKDGTFVWDSTGVI